MDTDTRDAFGKKLLVRSALLVVQSSSQPFFFLDGLKSVM